MLICGIDEVGRGPLAGPVVACALILRDNFDTSMLDDSKKLSEKKRFAIEEKLLNGGVVCFGIGCVSNIDIDRLNIHNASLQAMARAYWKMIGNSDINPEHVMVDGKFTPNLKSHHVSPKIPKIEAIVKGDSLIPSIMAASIIAKNYRDRLMTSLSVLYPEYKLEKHKGYPTKLHKSLIAQHGISKIHRKSFKMD